MLDPRIKIIAATFVMILLLATSKMVFLLLMVVFFVIIFLMAKLGLHLVFRNLKPFYFLFLLTFIIQIFFTKGQTVFTIPLIDFPIAKEGIWQAVFYTLRIGLFIMIANLLTLTTSPMSITDAIERFLSPFKFLNVPAHEIAMMMSISLRFIPILIEEAERIRNAQLSRGGSFNGHMVKKIKSIIPVVVPLFLATFRRANDLALAMDARCYRGSVGRTSYYKLNLSSKDIGAILIILSIGILFLIV